MESALETFERIVGHFLKDKEYKDMFGSQGQFGNFILERLFQDNSEIVHDHYNSFLKRDSFQEVNKESINEHILRAQVWLLGRAYSVSLERQQGISKTQRRASNEFYGDYISRLLMDDCYKEAMEELTVLTKTFDPKAPQPVEEEKVFKIFNKFHNAVINSHGKTHGLTRLSFASKFLFFKAPYIFYILDSYTEWTAKKVSESFPNDRKFQMEKTDENINIKKYCNHYKRIQTIAEYLKSSKLENDLKNKKLTPRFMDTVLSRTYFELKKRKS